MHTASGGATPLDLELVGSQRMLGAIDAGEGTGDGPADAGAPSILREMREREFLLRGAELGEADGVLVTLCGSASLYYSAGGELAASHRHAPDEEDLEAARAHVAHLVREAKIHFTQPGEVVAPAALAAAGTPFYVEVDAEGHRRLRRGYFA
jgi:hypothetical protein